MIKQFRESLGNDALFGKDTGEVLGGLFDFYMGQHLAQSGMLGIGAMVKKQLEAKGISHDSNTNTHAADQPALGRMSLALLTREESLLLAILAALERFRQNLASNVPGALTQAVEQCKEATALLGLVREQRDRFRQLVGSQLKVSPAAVTLRFVAEHVPTADAMSITLGRRRLRQLAEEIDRLSQSNALVIWWCLDFVQRVFAGILGHAAGGRYSAVGKIQPGASGSLLEAQG
jgi:Rod binding domain-containing protein